MKKNLKYVVAFALTAFAFLTLFLSSSIIFNWFGIREKEGVGFSNYESIGMRNRPKFSKASFELNANISKSISIIYF